ncbi:MAG: molybdopterin molybdotransferase MoeA [Planctomycetes bacterium]|nr:molybdopterin molybdotransferase MoeA [Planctomycetota bacterium]
MTLSVDEALRLLESEVPPPEAASIPLRDALGLVLAEDVAADMDFPPFAKAMMDGYAVVASDAAELEVVEEITAGQVAMRAVRPGTCAKIMTGAPVPPGADAVQQIEKTERRGSRVRLLDPVKPGQNVAPRGQDAREGEVVLRSGSVLRSASIGALAAVGRTEVRVLRRPGVALLVTGDEIVEPGEPLGPGQIRNSNAASLLAQLAEAGFAARYLGVARDREDEIRAKVREGLAHDVLILSGGVSAGDKDLVIPCLEAEGVRHRMHHVDIKPGRPFFYGTRDRKRVFGLPGNPVSTFVTFEVFVRWFLGRMCGLDLRRPRVRVPLRPPAPKKSDREQYLPAALGPGGAGPLPWKGSADLFTVARADAMIVVRPGEQPREGDLVEVMMLS